MRGKLSSRFVRGLALLILGGACALGVVAMPALAGTSSSTPTSTAPGVTTAAPRSPGGDGRHDRSASNRGGARRQASRRLSAAGLCQHPHRTSRALRQAGARLSAARRSAQSEHGEERAAGRKAGEPRRHPHLDLRRRQHLPWAPTCRSAWCSGAPTRCRPQRRRRIQLHRHHALRLQPDPRLRTRLRRRGRRADPADHRSAPVRRDPNNDHDPVQPHRRGRAGRLLLRAEQRSRTPSRRSSPRPRTARWAGSPSRRRHQPTSYQAAGQPERRLRRHRADRRATTRSQGSVTSGDFCGETEQRRPVPAVHGLLRHRVRPPVHRLAGDHELRVRATRPRCTLTFDTTSSPVIQAKVGISYVSAANAQLNWQTENPGWNFNAVKRRGADAAGTSCSARSRSRAAATPRPRSSTACCTRTSSSPTSPATSTASSWAPTMKVHTPGAAGSRTSTACTPAGTSTTRSPSCRRCSTRRPRRRPWCSRRSTTTREDKLLQQWGYLTT